MENGTFCRAPPKRKTGQSSAVDLSFTALGQGQTDCAVCAILSALGVQAFVLVEFAPG